MAGGDPTPLRSGGRTSRCRIRERHAPDAIGWSALTPRFMSVVGSALLLPATIAGAAGPAGTGSAGTEDPAAVREQVRRVMSRPEFSYRPSILERFGRWVGDELQKLFGGSGAPGAGGVFGGGIGSLVAWLLIVAAGVALVVLLVRIIATRTRSAPRERTPTPDIEVEHRRTAKDWAADAARLEAAGQWKSAMRARFRHLVRVLVDRHQLPDVAGRTTGELRGDLRASTPTATADFDSCCILFELPWYADAATGPEESARFRAAADRVLAAPVAHPLGIVSGPQLATADIGSVGTAPGDGDAALGAGRR
ncbi:MAG: hypothetical protein JST64_05280 [Actinobacteria bacterium]|nr:hypothetical protein [Actinomycetota bacterium]